ncbi:hypothetical protein ACMT9Y_08320 [Clavibacter tessellarius]
MVGAVVSITTQVLATRTERLRLQMAAREAENERRREGVKALVACVSSHLAELRKDITSVYENGANLEAAEALSAARYRILEMRELARASMTMVGDLETRKTANDVYSAWVSFTSDTSEAIVNQQGRGSAESVRNASYLKPDAFFAAVETYLASLDSPRRGHAKTSSHPT